ncbi:MAG TPA: hypothetical protein VGM88_14725 [Kofleriaceae bacterium]|jgi:hypothetical protein
MKKTSMFVVSVLAAAALVGACHKKTDSGTTTPTPAGSAAPAADGSAAPAAPGGEAGSGSAGGM